MINLTDALNPYKYAIIAASLAGLLVAGFGAGWYVNGTRKDVTISDKKTEIATLSGKIELQNQAAKTLERETLAAKVKAGEAQDEAARLSEIAAKRSKEIMALKARDCGQAASQVWGLVR